MRNASPLHRIHFVLIEVAASSGVELGRTYAAGVGEELVLEVFRDPTLDDDIVAVVLKRDKPLVKDGAIISSGNFAHFIPIPG